MDAATHAAERSARMKCLLNKDLHVAYPCSPSCALFGDCITAYEKSILRKPKTKADRVRSMNDEELAELLFHAAHDPNKPLNKQEVLEMLRAPAKEAK